MEWEGNDFSFSSVTSDYLTLLMNRDVFMMSWCYLDVEIDKDVAVSLVFDGYNVYLVL